MAAERERRLQLYEAVRRALWADWDPIGVRHTDCPSDEYDGYVAGVCRLLLAGATPEELADHLADVASQSMGCPATRQTELAAARRLIAVAADLRLVEPP